VGSAEAKLGSNVSNIRFLLPAMVLVFIALRNTLSSDVPDFFDHPFSTVTKEQFALVVIGFLTYRIPLFLRQLAEPVSDSAMSILPGSAGVAMKMAREAQDKKKGQDLSALQTAVQPTVLLVSGPPATGKTTLIKRLCQEDSRFVQPKLLDKITDGAANFEVLERRGSIINTDPTGRYGLTLESIRNATVFDEEGTQKQVVVLDANVDLTKKLLIKLTNTRIIGVWVGLDSLEKFESRIQSQIEQKAVTVPIDETLESFQKAKLRQAVRDIEYGVVSGIFEFTILNDDLEESVKQLKDAAEYCFK